MEFTVLCLLPTREALQVVVIKHSPGLLCFNDINAITLHCTPVHLGSIVFLLALIIIAIIHDVALKPGVCVQTAGCPDAGVSSLPHLRVPVHGPEEVPGLHPLWTVHGPDAGEGICFLPSNGPTFHLCCTSSILVGGEIQLISRNRHV